MRTSSIRSQVSHSGDAVLFTPCVRHGSDAVLAISLLHRDRTFHFRGSLQKLTVLSSQVSLSKEVRKYILEQDRSRVKPHLKYWDTRHKECTSVVACMPSKSRTLGFILSPSLQMYTYVCIDMDIDMKLLWP